MADLIINANNVDLYILPPVASNYRLRASAVVVEREQNVQTISDISALNTSGFLLGQPVHQFEMTIVGFPDEFVDTFVDREIGFSTPFDALVSHSDDGSREWEYSLETCVVENDELTTESGEPVEIAVEGYARVVDRA